MKIEIIANPSSGRGRGEDRARRIAERLSARGHQVGFHRGRNRADAVSWAHHASAWAERLVVVGGDGTLSAVLDGLGQAPPPLVLSPLGTANLLAHRLHLSPRPEDAVVLVERGRPQAMDVARVHYREAQSWRRRHAFLCLGFGFDGELMRRMDAERTGPITKAHYLKYIGEALRHWAPSPQRIFADGEELGLFSYGILAGVGTYGSSQFRIANSTLDDGQWELVMFENLNLFTGSLYAIAAAGGRLPQLPGVLYRQVQTLRIEGVRPTPLQVDGDHVGDTPVECRLDGLQVPIMVAP